MNVQPVELKSNLARHYLREVIEFRNEIVHPKDGPTGRATFVGLEHIERDTGIRLGAEVIDLKGMTGRRARFRAGDIVYGYLRPYLNKVWIAEFDGLCSVDQYVFKVRPDADRNYVYHFLRSTEFLRTAPIDAAPGQLPRIRSGEISATPIPLPPLDEQKRIAVILDKADQLRQKRRQAIALLDSLTQSIFLEMFGDPATNQRGWRTGRMADVLESANYGTSGKAGSTGQFPILRMGNITYDGCIDISDLKYIDLEGQERSKFTVRRGDILFNRTNSVDLVGKTAVFDLDSEFAFAGYLVRARVNSKAVPEFISSYLNSGYGKALLRSMAKSIVGMANINAKEMQAIEIPVPPIDLQREFVRKLEVVKQMRQKLLPMGGASEGLVASLQHRAFTGQL